MAPRTGTSPEQRKAEAQALHARLTAQVEDLRDSGQWQRFLDLAASFHSYSLNNVLLILAQRPTASAVAGFRQWQAKGRQVRKGEKAVKIIGYSTKKVTDADDDGNETTRLRARFPILSVFDIAQTDPIDDAEDVSTLAHQLRGEDTTGAYATVEAHLHAQGWTVEHASLGGSMNGYTTTDGSRRVVIEQDLSPAQAAKTLLHEAAHVTLHSDLDPAEYVQHRGTYETEAESVAYVLAGLIGLDTSAYSVGYIATWSRADVDLIRTTAENVMRAVHTLSGVLIPQDAETAA